MQEEISISLAGSLIFFLSLLPLIIWEMVWKGIGMWKAGRNNQLVWFICILIFNTAGILPILYLWLFQEKNSDKLTSTRKKKRR